LATTHCCLCLLASPHTAACPTTAYPSALHMCCACLQFASSPAPLPFPSFAFTASCGGLGRTGGALLCPTAPLPALPPPAPHPRRPWRWEGSPVPPPHCPHLATSAARPPARPTPVLNPTTCTASAYLNDTCYLSNLRAVPPLRALKGAGTAPFADARLATTASFGSPHAPTPSATTLPPFRVAPFCLHLCHIPHAHTPHIPTPSAPYAFCKQTWARTRGFVRMVGTYGLCYFPHASQNAPLTCSTRTPLAVKLATGRCTPHRHLPPYVLPNTTIYHLTLPLRAAARFASTDVADVLHQHLYIPPAHLLLDCAPATTPATTPWFERWNTMLAGTMPLQEQARYSGMCRDSTLPPSPSSHAPHTPSLPTLRQVQIFSLFGGAFHFRYLQVNILHTLLLRSTR